MSSKALTFTALILVGLASILLFRSVLRHETSSRPNQIGSLSDSKELGWSENQLRRKASVSPSSPEQIAIRKVRAASGIKPFDVEDVASLVVSIWNDEGISPADLLDAIDPQENRVKVLDLINSSLFSKSEKFAEWVVALADNETGSKPLGGSTAYTLQSMSEFGDYVREHIPDSGERLEAFRKLNEQIPSELHSLKRSLLRKELSVCKEEGLDSLANAFLSFPESDQVAAASFVFQHLVKEDVVLAIDVFNEMDMTDVETEREIASQLAHKYAHAQPNAALKWINSIESADVRKILLERAAYAIRVSDKPADINLIKNEEEKKLFIGYMGVVERQLEFPGNDN